MLSTCWAGGDGTLQDCRGRGSLRIISSPESDLHMRRISLASWLRTLSGISQANIQGIWAWISSLTRNILLRLQDSQQGLILGSLILDEYYNPLLLHRALHQNAHLWWQRGYGPRPGKHGLMPRRACLGIGTETRYSSAQTESGQ